MPRMSVTGGQSTASMRGGGLYASSAPIWMRYVTHKIAVILVHASIDEHTRQGECVHDLLCMPHGRSLGGIDVTALAERQHKQRRQVIGPSPPPFFLSALLTISTSAGRHLIRRP